MLRVVLLRAVLLRAVLLRAVLQGAAVPRAAALQVQRKARVQVHSVVVQPLSRSPSATAHLPGTQRSHRRQAAK